MFRSGMTGCYIYTRGHRIESTNKHLVYKERSLVGDSDKGSKEGSSQGERLCSEDPHGAAEQNPDVQGAGETPLTWEEHPSPSSLSWENLGGPTEKVGTLGLQNIKKNRCGADRKRVKMTKLAEVPSGDSGSGPQPSRGSQPQNLQKLDTSGAQRKTKEWTKHGPNSAGSESSDSKGHPKGPGKRQRPSGGTSEGGQTKRPKQAWLHSYDRAAREGIRMANVGEDYPGTRIYRENFVDIQWAIGQLVDELPEEGFASRLVESY